MDVETGHKAISEIADYFKSFTLHNPNEAETRKKVIDRILENVLGWSWDTDIKYEERVLEDKETKYADYVIRTATTAFIVEAKRSGASFSLPSNKTSARLNGTLSEGEVGDAIRQVRDYARKLSIPYGVVTNGSCWIIFPATRTDGVTFEESQALIFRSLDDIKLRFVKFWEILSRQRVIEGGMSTSLLGMEKSTTSHRLIATLKEPGYKLGRNSIYEHIEPAVLAALNDESLLDNVEALEACYVKSTERIKFDTRLQMHLKDIKPPLERKTVRPRHSKKSEHLDKLISGATPTALQFILVLGPVGAGKTTFLHYTRKVSAAKLIEGKVLWFNIDFKKATKEDNPREFIYRELLDLIQEDTVFNLGDWKESVNPSYADLINNLKRGPLSLLYNSAPNEFDKEVTKVISEEYNKIEPYVNRIIVNATQGRTGFLVIDNVDQHEDEEYQQAIFMEAQAAARKMKLNVMISLRDATYLKHKNTPVFDAFQVDSLYIDPPSLKPVLSRRFSYAKRVVAGKSAEVKTDDGIRIRVPDLSVFFEIVAGSLLDDQTGYMLEVLAGGDIRRGLTLVRDFLSSAHVSADRAIANYLSDGEHKFPAHELFKGAILGQRKYYREEESIIINLFDSKLGNSNLQLLRIIILNALITNSADATFEGIKVEDLQADLYKVGISSEDVMKVLKDLEKAKLIQTHNGMLLSSNSQVLPTRAAAFMLRELAGRLLYLEPCCIDSAIYDDSIWDELTEVTNEIESTIKMRRMSYRLKRAEIFLKYLESLERKWLVSCNRYGLQDNLNQDYIQKRLTDKIKQDLNSVESSARAAFAKNKK